MMTYQEQFCNNNVFRSMSKTTSQNSCPPPPRTPSLTLLPIIWLRRLLHEFLSCEAELKTVVVMGHDPSQITKPPLDTLLSELLNSQNAAIWWFDRRKRRCKVFCYEDRRWNSSVQHHRQSEQPFTSKYGLYITSVRLFNWCNMSHYE